MLRALASDACPVSPSECPRIVCVVRARDDAAAAERVKKTMEAYGLGDDYDASRVTVIAGDLEMDRLGLDANRYFSLAARLRM